jgi:L-cysteine/cystine lyase
MPRVPPDLTAVRAQVPCLASGVHMNTGACGPLPAAATAALHDWWANSERAGRGSGAWFAAGADEAERARAAAGRCVAAPADRIALTSNTTAGVNIVVWGIDWRPGDEIVVPALEHPGMAVPIATAARRHGITVRLVDRDGTAERLAEDVAAAVGPRTRLVALSHVSWATGAVLDVAGAAAAARTAGALVLVDGAQAVGAIPVDPAALGVDAYAFPAHKWLCGPGGLGALWIAAAAMERIELGWSGHDSGTGHAIGGGIVPHPGARRHEPSTLPMALLPAWRAAIEWIEGLGWGWVHERVAEAQASTRGALDALEGVRVLTPPGRQAGLVTFTLAGADPAAACSALERAGVVVRWLERPSGLRASAGFFTDASDVARLAEAVGAVAAGDGC